MNVTTARPPEAPPPPTLELLTTRQVARVLGCSYEHARRLLALGVVPVLDVALPGAAKRAPRVRAADLAGYLAGTARTEPGERSA